MANDKLFGNKIKALREDRGLMQRQVASLLDIDSPMLSHIERGDRRAKRSQLSQLAKVFKVKEEELLTFWLADKVFDMVRDEKVAKRSLQIVLEEFNPNNISSKELSDIKS